jgi:hypothetical protein
MERFIVCSIGFQPWCEEMCYETRRCSLQARCRGQKEKRSGDGTSQMDDCEALRQMEQLSETSREMPPKKPRGRPRKSASQTESAVFIDMPFMDGSLRWGQDYKGESDLSDRMGTKFLGDTFSRKETSCCFFVFCNRIILFV